MPAVNTCRRNKQPPQGFLNWPLRLVREVMRAYVRTDVKRSVHMMGWWGHRRRVCNRHYIALIVCMLVAGAVSGRPIFSDAERAWIAQHRVGRYAIDRTWRPLEYIERGKHIGLTRDYL